MRRRTRYLVVCIHQDDQVVPYMVSFGVETSAHRAAQKMRELEGVARQADAAFRESEDRAGRNISPPDYKKLTPGEQRKLIMLSDRNARRTAKKFGLVGVWLGLNIPRAFSFIEFVE